MLKEFKEFALKGNVLELAIGVIIGAAFNAIVTSLVTDVITPIIGMIFGKPDFSGIVIGSIMIGKFINAVVNFLIVAFVLFAVVKGMNTARAKFEKPEEEVEAAPAVDTKEELLKEIRDLLSKK